MAKAKQNIEQIEPLPDNYKITTSDENINNICNDFLQTYKNVNVRSAIGFTNLLKYIANMYISNFDIKNKHDYNIELLDYYFDIYIELCSNCNIKPSILGYSIYMNIPYDTINDWLSGQNRSSTHTQTTKKWRKICENVLYTDAINGNIGAMFGLKTRYGYSETAATPSSVQNIYLNAPTDRKSFLQQLGKQDENHNI